MPPSPAEEVPLRTAWRSKSYHTPTMW